MSSNSTTVTIPSMRSSPGVKEEDEELAALGGKTRLVPRKSPSLPSSPHDSRSTPSPKDSPVQRYRPDHIQLVHDQAVHGPTEHQSNHWPLYSQPVENGYNQYYQAGTSSQWTPDNGYPQSAQRQSPTLMMTPVQYSPYEQFPPMSAHQSYIPSHSPMEPQMQTDVNASWQSLYAQYQPGMVG